jgi:hypothetical protein
LDLCIEFLVVLFICTTLQVKFSISLHYRYKQKIIELTDLATLWTIEIIAFMSHYTNHRYFEILHTHHDFRTTIISWPDIGCFYLGSNIDTYVIIIYFLLIAWIAVSI